MTAATVITTMSQCFTCPSSWHTTASISRSSRRSNRPRDSHTWALPGVRPNVNALGVPSSMMPSRTSGMPASAQRRATSSPTGWSVR